MTKRHIMDFSPRSAKINVYVGNLALTVTEAELRQVFLAFGQVIGVSIMNDEYIGSRQPRGYVFVEMAVRLQGEAAIASLNGKSLRNRVISVIEALPLSPSKGVTSRSNRCRCRS